jgi:hypothetical protein
MRRNFPLVVMLLLCTTFSVGDQLWSDVLDSSRAVNWTGAGAGPIPDASWPMCSTAACQALCPNAPQASPAACKVGTVTMANIQSAVTSASASTYVPIPAGTFTGLSGSVNMKSNVALRGAGADQTILKFKSGGGSGCATGGFFCISNGDNGDYQLGTTNQGTWTAPSYAQGSNQITLSMTKGSAPAVGNLMVLFQKDPSSDPGTIWNCQADPCSSEQQPGQNGPTNSSQTQTVTVTAVSGSGPYTVTFTPALYSPIWSGSSSPGAYWSAIPPITGVGIENMTLDASATTDSPGSAGTLIQIFWGSYNWITGVRTLNTGTPPYRNNIWLYQSAHNTIESNYVYGSDGWDLSYGIEISYESSDNLADNNILQHTATAEIVNGGEGNVYAYNYSVDNYYTAQGSAPSFQQADSYPIHQDGSYYNLYEGNVGAKFVGDVIHGTGWMNTAFRNYWKGADGPFKTSSTQVIDLESYARYFNIIGNVLGTPGYHTNYKDAATSPTDNAGCNSTGPVSIMTLGFAEGNGCYTGGNPPDDPNVGSYVYLWGNYDTVTGAVRWCGNSSDPGWSSTCGSKSEVPTSLSSYAQTVPSSTTLPNSFYYQAQPGWYATAYGTPPFPAIGPDVSGGTGPGGYAYAIPAQLCFNNTGYDSNYAVQSTIASISENGTTATMTLTASAPSSFAQYQSFWISGNSVSGYNGLQQIATVSGKTITFIAAPGLGSSSGGTAAVNAIHVFNSNSCYGSSSGSPVPPPTNLSGVGH